MLRKFLASAALAAALSVSGHALAFTTITNGAYTVGIGDNGELFDYNSYIGFQRGGDGFDPLAPGSPYDAWGVNTSAGSAYGAGGSGFNVGATIFTGGGASLTANTSTGAGVDLTQKYSFVGSGGNILKIQETLTNTSGGALSGVNFARNVDWDVSPTPFDENSFGPAISGNVINSTYYGFESPLGGPYYSSCNGGCNSEGDLGGGIQISLGSLADGQSVNFTYFYGINGDGEDVNGLIADAQAAGAGYIIATQSVENGLYPSLGANSALIGVASAPEPGAWALMILGVIGLGGALRAHQKADRKLRELEIAG